MTKKKKKKASRKHKQLGSSWTMQANLICRVEKGNNILICSSLHFTEGWSIIALEYPADAITAASLFLDHRHKLVCAGLTLKEAIRKTKQYIGKWKSRQVGVLGSQMWSTHANMICRVRRGQYGLACSLISNLVGGWDIVAVEGKIRDIESTLSDHRHELIGSNFLLEEAMKTAEQYVKKWKPGQYNKCDCEEL